MVSQIIQTEEQKVRINELIKENDREVPLFYEEGITEEIYIPVDGAELRVFYYKPKTSETKRPILFVSGFGTSPWSWRDFNKPLFEKGEYYFLETREKTSSKILTKRQKTKMSMDQKGKDIAEVIRFLGLESKDFVLFGTSYCASIILTALAKNYFTAPTIVVHDPTYNWKRQRRMYLTLGLIPSFILSPFRMTFAKLVLLGLNNPAAKERYLDFVKNAEVWKWKRSIRQNFDFNLPDYLSNITNEIFLVHGPKDRYHGDDIYEKIVKQTANGRYLYMLSDKKYRELVVGIVAYEFAKVTQNNVPPETLKIFEFNLKD